MERLKDAPNQCSNHHATKIQSFRIRELWGFFLLTPFKMWEHECVCVCGDLDMSLLLLLFLVFLSFVKTVQSRLLAAMLAALFMLLSKPPRKKGAGGAGGAGGALNIEQSQMGRQRGKTSDSPPP